jgi:acetyltransferase EpsM
MMNSIVILGAGGHGRDIKAILNNSGDYNFLGFLDDDKEKIANDVEVLGPISDYTRLMSLRGKDLYYLIGINDPNERRRLCDYMDSIHARAGMAIHRTADLGYQNFYKPGLVMGPYSVLTTLVNLGRHVHLNTGASVNQGSYIGDFCTLSPGARVCGDVQVGDTTYLGANATVINLMHVGRNSIVGAGAVVVDDIPSDSVAVGVPAKVIKENSIV